MRIEPTATVPGATALQASRGLAARDASGAAIDVLIAELSETGALLDVAGGLPVGTLVRLVLPELGPQLARITGTERQMLVARFVNPLNTAQVALARAVAGPLTGLAIPLPAEPSRPAAAPSAAAIDRSPDQPVLTAPAAPAEALTYSPAALRAVRDPAIAPPIAIDARAAWALPALGATEPSPPGMPGRRRPVPLIILLVIGFAALAYLLA